MDLGIVLFVSCLLGLFLTGAFWPVVESWYWRARIWLVMRRLAKGRKPKTLKIRLR